MNTLITIDISKVTKETKGLSAIQQTCLKTKTKLEIRITNKDQGFQELVTDDIVLLQVEGEKLDPFIVTVEGAKAIGRIVNRSVPAFGRLGVTVSEMDWEANSGVIEMGGELTTIDLPYLTEIILRLTQRATKSISHTHHPLSLYDLKQAIGHVYDLKQEAEGAEDLSDWFALRELNILEEERETKATKRAETKAENKKKRKEERRVPDPKSGPLATSKDRKATASKAGKASHAKTEATGKAKATEKNGPLPVKKSAGTPLGKKLAGTPLGKKLALVTAQMNAPLTPN